MQILSSHLLQGGHPELPLAQLERGSAALLAFHCTRQYPLITAPRNLSLPCRVDIQNYRLRNWNAAVQRQLLERPTEYLPGLQDAVGEYVKSSEDFAGEFNNEDSEILVGLKGEFGELEVSPRNLNSSHLGKLVKVSGCNSQHYVA